MTGGAGDGSPRDWLYRQIGLGLAGGLVWLAGVRFESGALRAAGFVLLVCALALRLARRASDRSGEEPDDGGNPR